MTPNAQNIREVAIHGWSANLPISWCLAMCINKGYHRTFIKRFIEVIYDEWDARIDVWYRNTMDDVNTGEITK